MFLAGEGKMYKEVLINGRLFPQKTNPVKLIKLLKFARDNVNYYKLNFPKISFNPKGFLKAFGKLNFYTDKTFLKSNIYDFVDPKYHSCVKNLYESKSVFSYLKNILRGKFLLSFSTSGSSGHPLNYFKDKRTCLRMILQFLETGKYFGWREGEVFFSCFQKGAYFDIGILNSIVKYMGLPIFVFDQIDSENCERYFKLINKMRPTALMGFPSYLAEFAHYRIKNKIKIESPIKIVICVGEMLTESQKKFLELSYQTTVCNLYGASEAQMLALSCKKNKGLHVFENFAFVENDKKKNIVVTTMEQYDMPLIKYRTNDTGTVVERKCPCGISGKMITKLEGRIEEFLINGSGKKVYSSYLRQVLMETNEKFGDVIVQTQFAQKKNLTLEFVMELIKKDKAKDIVNYISGMLKKELKIKVKGKIVPNLVQKKGKFHFLIQKKEAWKKVR